MVVIRLYGVLEAAAQRAIRLHTSTLDESLRGLFANFPKLKSLIRDMRVSILVNGQMITFEDCLRPMDVERIDIMPAVGGAGPAIFIVVGSALVAGAEAIATFLSISAITAASVASFGLSMIVGGISQLLIKPPKPTIGSSAADSASYLFNGAVNLTQQGNPVPIGYGRLRVGSVVVAANVQTWDIPIGPNAPTAPPAPSADPNGPFLVPITATQ